MTAKETPFGEIGYWSEIKLDIIKEYAAAYSMILSAQKKSSLYHLYIGRGGDPRRPGSTRTMPAIRSPMVTLMMRSTYSGSWITGEMRRARLRPLPRRSHGLGLGQGFRPELRAGQRRSIRPGGATTGAPPLPPFITATTLWNMQHAPTRWGVPGIIPEGVTLLGGKPKTGKSWLAIGLAIAVGTGGRAFGAIQVDSGPVLYLALEDTKRRLTKRLRILCSTPHPNKSNS